MDLTDTQYLAFVAARLKLPKGKRSDYIKQVDTLIERFSLVAKESEDIGVRQFRKTGSLWKGTILRPRDGKAPDADVAVYINIEDGDNALEELHERIRKLLMKAYPTKSPDDFKVQPRTLGISFLASGLDVDLVPVIPVDETNSYGHQPSSQGAPLLLTSIPAQLAFINARKAAYVNWTAVVRLLKRWRNHQDLSSLRSFTIELIVSYLQVVYGNPPSIGQALSRVWLFMAQDLSNRIVSFNGVQGGQGANSYEPSPIVVIDPVNASNNVTVKISGDEATEIAAVSLEAWERFADAGTIDGRGEALKQYRLLFGNDFDLDFE